MMVVDDDESLMIMIHDDESLMIVIYGYIPSGGDPPAPLIMKIRLKRYP